MCVYDATQNNVVVMTNGDSCYSEASPLRATGRPQGSNY